MSEVDFLVKLRDAAVMIKDAAEERLEKLGPPGANQGQGAQWDPSRIQWEKRSGANGEYERSVGDPNSSDFKVMIADLDAHQGKLTRDGLFYWKFSDNLSAGRKPRKQ